MVVQLTMRPPASASSEQLSAMRVREFSMTPNAKDLSAGRKWLINSIGQVAIFGARRLRQAMPRDTGRTIESLDYTLTERSQDIQLRLGPMTPYSQYIRRALKIPGRRGKHIRFGLMIPQRKGMERMTKRLTLKRRFAVTVRFRNRALGVLTNVRVDGVFSLDSFLTTSKVIKTAKLKAPKGMPVTINQTYFNFDRVFRRRVTQVVVR